MAATSLSTISRSVRSSGQKLRSNHGKLQSSREHNEVRIGAPGGWNHGSQWQLEEQTQTFSGNIMGIFKRELTLLLLLDAILIGLQHVLYILPNRVGRVDGVTTGDDISLKLVCAQSVAGDNNNGEGWLSLIGRGNGSVARH